MQQGNKTVQFHNMKRRNNMNTLRKQELVTEWGFQNTVGGLYHREIYADQGYTEQWTTHNPDVISFIKGGEITEEYKIDWALFN
jgi:hypothetical protein